MNEQLSLFDFDSKIRLENNIINIAGFDESGRGPLAGPLSVCGLILKKDYKNDLINDSKKLTDKQRRDLFGEIISNSLAYEILLVDVETIDRENILEADREAMQTILEHLKQQINIDYVITDYVKINTELKHMYIAKADAKSQSVAAASILAKVTRDNYMIELDKKYPVYGFKKNKGYGTKKHIEAIKKYGYVDGIHRLTFDPVKTMIKSQDQTTLF